MKKPMLAACGLAILSLTACENIKGAHLVVRSAPLPPVVASTLSADGKFTGYTPMLEQQVDVAAVLTSVLEQKGHHVELGDDTLPATDGINLTGYDADHRLNMLITYSETTLPPATLKSLRTSLASQLLYASDTNCSEYLLGLRGGQVSSRLATDLLAAGFSLTGTLAKLPATAKRMSAYAGTASAIGATIDRDVFSQQAAELIADAIVQKRSTMESGLRTHFKDAYDDWPIGTVLADVAMYHQECSVTRGLASMREVIIAREQTIHAIRLAAASVEEKGGDGKQVLAVLAGLEPTSGKPLEVLPPSWTTGDGVREDLDGIAELVDQCGVAVLTAVTGTAGGVVDESKAAKVKSSCDATKGSALQKKAMAVYRDNLLVNISDFQATAVKITDGITNEERSALQKELFNKYRASQARAQAQVASILNSVNSMREAFDLGLDGPEGDVTVDKVVARATSYLSDDDPGKTKLISALNGMKKPPSTEEPAKGAKLANLVRHTWEALRQNEMR